MWHHKVMQRGIQRSFHSETFSLASVTKKANHPNIEGAGGTGTWSLPACHPLEQRSPTFLAPGTSFVDDNFSMDGGGGEMVQATMRAMGSGR